MLESINSWLASVQHQQAGELNQYQPHQIMTLLLEGWEETSYRRNQQLTLLMKDKTKHINVTTTYKKITLVKLFKGYKRCSGFRKKDDQVFIEPKICFKKGRFSKSLLKALQKFMDKIQITSKFEKFVEFKMFSMETKSHKRVSNPFSLS